MGSGGSHALWPVTNLTSLGLLFKRFGGVYIPELDDPNVFLWVVAAVYVGPCLLELVLCGETFSFDVCLGDFTEVLLVYVCDVYPIWEVCTVVLS